MLHLLAAAIATPCAFDETAAPASEAGLYHVAARVLHQVRDPPPLRPVPEPPSQPELLGRSIKLSDSSESQLLALGRPRGGLVRGRLLRERAAPATMVITRASTIVLPNGKKPKARHAILRSRSRWGRG